MNPPPRTTARTMARAFFDQGNRLREQGRASDALVAYREAVIADPELGEAWLNLGHLQELAGNLAEAAAGYLRATELRPDLPEAHLNLGNVCLKRGDHEAARASFQRAVGLHPDLPEAHLNLGHAHRLRNELAAAEAACRRALVLRPGYADAWTNLANILRAQNRLDEALSAAQRAVALAPRSPQAHLNLGMAHLVRGELPAGWPHAEFRHALRLGGAGREFSQPQWTGAEPLAGKSILLHGEQGFGDTLMFVRFVSVVAAHDARVILEVQPPLKTLLEESYPGLAGVFASGETLPRFDVHCPLPSLPLALGVELATIPRRAPYLFVSDEKLERRKTIFAGGPCLRVGLAWAGNPTHPNDYNRSIPLVQLAALIAGEADVRWFSLKKEMSPADAAVLSDLKRVEILAPRLEDFSDTAAAICQLDLVIAVDTSVAHLAGALGRPVWVLLPFSPDWRWLLDRADSPWYPSVRLFRQPRVGDWATVMAEVGAALRTFKARPARMSS